MSYSRLGKLQEALLISDRGLSLPALSSPPTSMQLSPLFCVSFILIGSNVRTCMYSSSEDSPSGPHRRTDSTESLPLRTGLPSFLLWSSNAIREPDQRVSRMPFNPLDRSPSSLPVLPFLTLLVFLCQNCFSSSTFPHIFPSPLLLLSLFLKFWYIASTACSLLPRLAKRRAA